jgi:hypothetical protein
MVWEDGPSEIYDPTTGSFTRTGSPVYPSYNDGLPSATLVMNGTVLIAGGADDTGIRKAADTFDPSTGSFTATGNMSTAHALQTATLLPDGSVLIAGSYVFGGGVRSNTEVYDPVAGSFHSPVDMTAARIEHTATLLNDGRVLMAGGNIGSNVSTPLAELYTPTVLAPAPALLSLTGDGGRQGAVLHAGTARVVSASDPACAGEALEVYGVGLSDGGVIPPQLAIGGQLAEVLYFGNAPGFAGLNQINVRMPGGIAPGPDVPVRMTYLDRSSNVVTIYVR